MKVLTKSNVPKQYVTYTCNYIDKKTGELKLGVLETLPFGDLAHTGENIESKLLDVINYCKLKGNHKIYLMPI